MPTEPTVFVVDDDERVRRSVSALVSTVGLAAKEFSSAEEFLDDYVQGRPGCLVTDVRMPGISGLELQKELRRRNISLPVIIFTAYARTPMTVCAIQDGAVTVLDKPYEDDDLWDAIREALAQDAADRAEYQRCRELRRRINQLTPRQRQVMGLIVAGRPNNAIARQLEVSVRTIENGRHEVFERMQVHSVAELVRTVTEANACE